MMELHREGSAPAAYAAGLFSDKKTKLPKENIESLNIFTAFKLALVESQSSFCQLWAIKCKTGAVLKKRAESIKAPLGLNIELNSMYKFQSKSSQKQCSSAAWFLPRVSSATSHPDKCRHTLHSGDSCAVY